MISADLAESDFTDETSPEAACAVVLFVFGLIPRVLRMPSAIPFAIWLKFLSNVSLSLSLLIKPASTSTAGIFVRLSTTRLGRSVIPRFLKPAFSSSELILAAICDLIPELL